MHTSRMRTGRALTVFRSLLLPGGVSGPGGVCSAPRGVSAWGGDWSGGQVTCLVLGGWGGLVRHSPPCEQNE